MIKNKDSLKAKISNLSKEINIPNNYLIQNFMFESLLKRISKSKYKDNFIFKGGFIISSIFGVNLRSTMDLDATIKGLLLTKDNLEKIINEILTIDVNDNIKLKLLNIKDIRLEDEYFGYNVNIVAEFDGLKTNLMIDITPGDIITYKEVSYDYKTMFENENINIMTYNFETIIAEKYETIIYRNIDNTRMKDYYDLYMFVNLMWKKIDNDTLKKAIKNTSVKRKTEDFINNSNKYINLIEKDDILQKLWSNYIKNYEYAKDITYEDIIKAIKKVYELIK